MAEYQRTYRERLKLKGLDAFRARERNFNLRSNYGISLIQYNELLSLQQGCCAICGTTESSGKSARLHVDHDHRTGIVRGLLCHTCNTGLGLFKDDPDLLSSAIEYLGIPE